MPDITGTAVNHPPHYNAGKVECIDAIEAALTPAEFRGFLRGNAIKYLWRAGLKGDNATTDLEKAQWYISREVGKEEAGK